MEEGFSRPSIQLLPFAFLLLPLSGLRLGRLWERNKHSNNPQSEFLRPPPQIDFFLPHSYLMVYQRNTQKRSYLLWLCFSVVTISLPDGRRLFSPMNPTFAFCLLTFAFREGRLPAPSLRGAPRSLYLMTSLAKVIVVQIPTCRWQPTYRLPLQRLRRAPGLGRV